MAPSGSARAEGASVAGGSKPDLWPGEEKLPTAEAGSGHARDAARDRGRSQSRLTGIGLLWEAEHGFYRAGESDHPPWNSCVGSSNLGYSSANPTPASFHRMVAGLLSFCASPPSAAGSARAAARARWQAGGATLSAADASDGGRQNPSTMDGSRGALVPVAAAFRLKADEARCGWSVTSRGNR